MLLYSLLLSPMNSLPHDSITFVATLKSRALSLLFVFFIVFTLSNIFFTAFGITPNFTQATDEVETPSVDVVDESVATTTMVVSEEVLEVVVARSAEPRTITIDKLNRTLPINNPTSRAISDLDAALLTGVVRHPDSADMTQDGTVFILGHSSYLPKVNNKMFQAFNGIQKLVWGDTIRITTDDAVYVYQVDNVYKANAKDVSVPIANTGARLTIATCDSFGSTSDRFMVEAVLLYSEPLPLS